VLATLISLILQRSLIALFIMSVIISISVPWLQKIRDDLELKQTISSLYNYFNYAKIVSFNASSVRININNNRIDLIKCLNYNCSSSVKLQSFLFPSYISIQTRSSSIEFRKGLVTNGNLNIDIIQRRTRSCYHISVYRSGHVIVGNKNVNC